MRRGVLIELLLVRAAQAGVRFQLQVVGVNLIEQQSILIAAPLGGSVVHHGAPHAEHVLERIERVGARLEMLHLAADDAEIAIRHRVDDALGEVERPDRGRGRIEFFE